MSLLLVGTITLCVASLGLSLPTNGNKVPADLSNAVNQFSTEFYQHVAENENGNVVMSPISAHLALGMIALGAQKETSKILRKSLHMPEDDKKTAERFSTIMSILNSNEALGVNLKSASKVFNSKQITPKEKFQQLLKNSFNSQCQTIDFEDSEKAARMVNNWVDEETDHKINKIIESDAISPSTSMLLANTIYFNGKWTYAFDESLTEIEPFFCNKNTIKRVNMMYNTLHVINGEVPDLPAHYVILPYGDGILTMTIIVPDEIEGLSQIGKNLHLLDYEILHNMENNKTVEVYVPRFKIENTLDLATPLEKMGMAEIFTNSANFKGIADIPIKVSKVLQKSFIEVTESGTVAAAESSVSITNKFTQNMIKVNRPSLVIIRKAQVDLFIARLYDPTV